MANAVRAIPADGGFGGAAVFAGAAGRDWLCAADCVRERGESAAGARWRARTGNGGANCDGGLPVEITPAVADRSHADCAGGWLGTLLALAPVNLPRVEDVHLNGAVLTFTLLVALVTGVLFGVAPAAYAMRTNLNDTLKDGAGRASAGAGRARLRQGLVIGELAISLVLLTGAGLMIATFAKLLNTNPGFNPHHVLSMQFWLTGSKYRTTPEIANFYRALEQRIGGLPGVEDTAVVAAG